MKPIVLAGGGTGGHVFPLVAVAQALRRARPGIEVVFVGTRRGLETKILGDLGERLELMKVEPIKGGGLRGAIKGVSSAAQALPAARALLRRIDPAGVLSIGGYAAGPVALAARFLRIPLAILEPNSVLGLTNKLVVPFVQRAYVAFPETLRWFRSSVGRQFGVPLREGFEPADYEPRSDSVRVLVLGGSQGAVTLNRYVPLAISLLRTRIDQRVEVLHQCGRGRETNVEQAYEKVGELRDVTVTEFIQDVAYELRRADIVVQRAGAGALAEVCAVGRPSILIPYPYAAGNHQLHNAEALEREGAAICIPSQDADANILAEALERLASSPEQRKAMALAAKMHGRPNAAQLIAEDFLQLTEGH